MKLTEEQILKASQMRVRLALAAVQRAQDELGRASEMLSALQHAAPVHQACGKLYDQVHAFWYRVDGLQHNVKVRLDPENIAALEKRMEESPPAAQGTG